MCENEFWKIIEQAVEISKNDPEKKEEVLREKLEKLTPEEIFEFAKIFDEKDAKAYRWDLWGAAYIIGGGCGDDSFMDFRASLICMGKEIYTNAIKDPDSLANIEMDNPEEDLFFEGYQYLHFSIYEDKTDNDMPSTEVSFPEDPEGEEWSEESEDDLQKICPKLFEIYPI
jgi:hypothetical protein